MLYVMSRCQLKCGLVLLKIIFSAFLTCTGSYGVFVTGYYLLYPFCLDHIIHLCLKCRIASQITGLKVAPFTQSKCRCYFTCYRLLYNTVGDTKDQNCPHMWY